MWPPTAWIVTGRPSGLSQEETGPGTGRAASLPQSRRSPDGMTAASAPKRSTWSKTAAVRSQSGPVSPFGHASSTGAGRSIVSTGVSPRSPGTVVSTARERSGRLPFSRL